MNWVQALRYNARNKKGEQMEHVYILGAGFSVPLGGPLFNELLTYRLKHHSDSIEIRSDMPDGD